jgi:tetratricopeptide (TPR) repeat protein
MTANSLSPDQKRKNHLRSEMLGRIKEAVESKDWNQLDTISKQWIESDPMYGAPFKWLARASLALGHTAKAAYAYGRYLDFDKNFEEAKKFFKEHPSSLDSQPDSVRQTVGLKHAESYSAGYGKKAPSQASAQILEPENRRLIAEHEFILAETYKKFLLFAEASVHFLKSHEWHPSKAAALGYAVSMHRSQRGNEGVRFLRDQLFTYSDWTEGRLLLGKILFDIGLRGEAQREWQIVLDFEPNNIEALNYLRNLLAFNT